MSVHHLRLTPATCSQSGDETHDARCFPSSRECVTVLAAQMLREKRQISAHSCSPARGGSGAVVGRKACRRPHRHPLDRLALFSASSRSCWASSGEGCGLRRRRGQQGQQSFSASAWRRGALWGRALLGCGFVDEPPSSRRRLPGGRRVGEQERVAAAHAEAMQPILPVTSRGELRRSAATAGRRAPSRQTFRTGASSMASGPSAADRLRACKVHGEGHVAEVLRSGWSCRGCDCSLPWLLDHDYPGCPAGSGSAPRAR